MKQLLLAMVLCCTSLFAADYKNPVTTNTNVSLQATVGEAAVNNILATYFNGQVKQMDVAGNKGTVTVTIKNVGIDIQGPNKVIANLSFLVSTNVPSIPELSLSNVPIDMNVPLKESFVVGTVDQAYVVFMSLKSAVDYALKEAMPVFKLVNCEPVAEAIANAFNIVETKYVVPVQSTVQNRESYFAVWKQNFGSLLKERLDKVNQDSDFRIIGFSAILNVGGMADHLTLTFNATIQVTNQYFLFEGGVLSSNKEFTLLSIVGMPVMCFANGSEQPALSVNAVDFCKDHGRSDVTGSVLKSIHSYKVKTKHGGIITFFADNGGVR